MPAYTLLLYTHVSCVVLSISLFLLRGIWMIRESPFLSYRLVRVLPHVIDTVLLISAIGLTITLGQYPFFQSWLTAKVIALLLYIGLGTVALKLGRRKMTRVIAFVLALVVVSYIVTVAWFHHPAGLLAPLLRG